MRYRLSLSTALLITPILAAGSQTTRWNDRSNERAIDDAPPVTVWFENSRELRFGSSARVRFRVEDDAYVVVGRVDSDGRMTILFPYNRTGRAFVQGGADNIVRSRRGGSAYSFTAYERWGVGFVFAISSYEPLDFSRFQSRDFQSYDGVANSIARRYIGSPEKVVERFAPWVLWDKDTPYEWDIVNYAVESPTYASYSPYCGGGYYGNYGGYGGMYNQGFCNSAYGYYGFFCSSFFGYGSALCYDPYFGRFGNRGGTIAYGPPAVPTTPIDKVPNTKLIPQLGHPGDDGKINGVQKGLEPLTRPTTGGTVGDDELDHVYSIPRRALDDMRRQERVEGRPIGEITRGTGVAVPGSDARPAPRNGGDGRPGGEGRPAGNERRERGEDPPLGTSGRQDWGRDRDNPTTRGDTRRSAEPPPRESPRNDPPPRERGNGDRVGGSSGRSSEPPPRSYDPPSRSEPRRDPSPSSSGGGSARSAPPPPPHAQAPAVREPPRTSEKKPEEP